MFEIKEVFINIHNYLQTKKFNTNTTQHYCTSGNRMHVSVYL